MQLKVLVLVASAFCTRSVFAQMQPAETARTSVHYAFPNVTVQVGATSSLQSVLKELCRETQADCSGIEYTASYNVAPSTFRGNWGEVVNQLMDGTALNYAAGPPSRSQAGKLVIQGQRASLPTPWAAPAQNFSRADVAPAPTMEASDSNAASPEPNQDPGTSPTTSAAPAMSATASTAGATAMGSSSGAAPGTIGSPLTSEMPANTSSNEPQYFPFPDGHGNLIPLSREPMQYLPFPDSHGNLIPAKPSEPGGPFPDWAIHRAQQR